MKLNKKGIFATLLVVSMITIGMFTAFATNIDTESYGVKHMHILEKDPHTYVYQRVNNAQHRVIEEGFKHCTIPGCYHSEPYISKYLESHSSTCTLCD